jgi:transposase-like protein
MKTAAGMVEFAAPQVRETAEPFVSGIRQNLAGRTGALEDLAVGLYARGLSTRDIEDAFTDEAGRRLLSRAAVSEITERLWAEYEAFTTRDLDEYRVVYLFVDGIAERLRAGQAREAVLAAWGIGEDGRKVLLHLMAGSKEDTETVRAFFQDMRGRGLGDPLLVVCDGAPGIIRAIEECFPRSARQRCLAHRMRNLAVKVPTDLWPEFKARASACYQEPSLVTSPRACGPTTARCCRAPSRALKTTSRPASPTCGSRSRIGGRPGPRTFSSASSSRSDGGSRSSPTASARSPCSS